MVEPSPNGLGSWSYWQDERALKHNYVGTEHILLGLVRENEGVAAYIQWVFVGAAEARLIFKRPRFP